MSTLNAYIWDLDGTLLDSYGSIVSSLAEVAEACGAHDSPDKILRTVKQGSVSGYLRDLAAARGCSYEGLFRAYRQASHGKLEEITLISGAAETLRALREKGATHFVYTHRGASAMPLLDRLGIGKVCPGPGADGLCGGPDAGCALREGRRSAGRPVSAGGRLRGSHGRGGPDHPKPFRPGGGAGGELTGIAAARKNRPRPGTHGTQSKAQKRRPVRSDGPPVFFESMEMRASRVPRRKLRRGRNQKKGQRDSRNPGTTTIRKNAQLTSVNTRMKALPLPGYSRT